jgi:hypothetical protein
MQLRTEKDGSFNKKAPPFRVMGANLMSERMLGEQIDRSP